MTNAVVIVVNMIEKYKKVYLELTKFKVLWSNISYTKLSASSGFQTRENWCQHAAAGRQSAFIVFKCLGTPMKHEGRVYEMAFQKGLI